MSASFSMVTLSIGGVAGQDLIDRNLALEAENKSLRSAVDTAATRRARDQSDVEAYESALASVRAGERVASARVRVLEVGRRRLQRRLDAALHGQAVAERRAEQAEAQGLVDRARADAAAAMATAAEDYALQLDARYSRTLVERDRLQAENVEIRNLASRHLPQVTPAKARHDLELLRGDLQRAKADAGRDRDYLVGLACSGLRTFEASAASYGDHLGRRLLSEARALRHDPACVALDEAAVITADVAVP